MTTPPDDWKPDPRTLEWAAEQAWLRFAPGTRLHIRTWLRALAREATQ